MNKLTRLEEEMLDYIKETIANEGYSPSVRDISTALGIKSTSTVHLHLHRLEELGYIQKEQGKSRTIRVDAAAPSGVPIVGNVAAGMPILAEQNIDGYVDFQAGGYDKSNLFALHVKGESMNEAGILDGDVVIAEQAQSAENGDLVIALVDDEATVKTFYKENGYYRLQPANSAFAPILVDHVEILGKVRAVYRFY